MAICSYKNTERAMKIIDDFEECMCKIKYIERANSDVEAAKALGMPVSTFSEYKKRRKLPIKKMLNYCESRSISIDWLLLKKVS